MADDTNRLLSTLKEYFGFDSFRPLQEDIIRDSLAGKDGFVLLPTGGGKSLCFQLPALLREGLTIVVSPLIALMKDQVDALQSAGVPATFLNSSLAKGEAAPRMRGLHNGEYKLLYVAPERLMLSGFLDDLKRWKVNAFAIDEAHCISEWGHDFRPEYRKLAQVRELFPNVPMMALTATATERVREDIVRQLHLRDAAIYVASFNRENLSYRVLAKARAYDQILDFLESCPADSGIIYAQSRRSTETLAAKLNADGVEAVSYHAGMNTADRSRNQEAFLRDEVRVVCATVAFGMGINKPNVRFVIHHDLPKNVESYYQETGRAGRDGLPSDCLLLFSPGDRVKYGRFIDEKPDAKEREIAHAQLEQMVHYAECSDCRRMVLLDYFGEQYAEDNCGGCDNCLSPRETFDGTVLAQKFLSCVFRIRQMSGFAVGITHVVEVLCGAETEKIRRWNHQSLSTYGIGSEHSRKDWAAIGRELVRLGLLRQDAEKFNTAEVTSEGMEVLKSRQPVTLTRPMAVPESARHRAGEIECDEELFQRLRNLRKRLADERGVPPYIIFSDVALRQMARQYPHTEGEFGRISGVGEKKRREFGEIFISEIVDYLGNHPRRQFSDETVKASPRLQRSLLTETVMASIGLFRAGSSPEDIARQRGLKVTTILGHLASGVDAGESIDLDRLLDPEARREIEASFGQHGFESLGKVFEALGGRYDYGLLRVFRSCKQRSDS